MDWVIAAAVFVAQLLCCIYSKNRIVRYLPIVLVVLVMVLTLVVGSSMGSAGLVGALLLMLPAGKSLLMAVLALGLYKLVLYTK